MKELCEALHVDDDEQDASCASQEEHDSQAEAPGDEKEAAAQGRHAVDPAWE